MTNTPQESADQYQTLTGAFDKLIDGDVRRIITVHMENLERTESWRLAKPYFAQEAQHLFESYLTRAISEIVREVIMPNLRLQDGGGGSVAQIEKFKSVFIEVFNEVFRGCELEGVRDLIAPKFCEQVMCGFDIEVLGETEERCTEVFMASVVKGVAEIEQDVN